MKRALSVNNILTAKFNRLPFSGQWLQAVGNPELTGSWVIYGAPKNGKTSFAFMLAKYLTEFRRVAYDSVEEGKSLTMQMQVERHKMLDVSTRFTLLDKEDIEELKDRLDKHKSPDVVFIDSVQFLDMKFSEYKELKARYPQKLFVYISHVNGNQPEGQVAKRIWRDANVIFRVEGFRAFPTSRYGGGAYIDVWKERAEAYYGIVE
ncbi:MAG: ATP-binding protein [Paludibacteraceae bacterium]|nr:ATP-binding protein [Paludibacteraceae bacterium]